MNWFGKQTAPRNEGDADAPVKVLGMGCAGCRELEKVTRQAMAELGQPDGVEYVTDPARIAALGVMTTPALMIDGKVVSSGRRLSREDVKDLLRGRDQ